MSYSLAICFIHHLGFGPHLVVLWGYFQLHFRGIIKCSALNSIILYVDLSPSCYCFVSGLLQQYSKVTRPLSVQQSMFSSPLIFVCFGGLTQQCSGVTPWSVFRNYSWRCSGTIWDAGDGTQVDHLQDNRPSTVLPLQPFESPSCLHWCVLDLEKEQFNSDIKRMDSAMISYEMRTGMCFLHMEVPEFNLQHHRGAKT